MDECHSIPKALSPAAPGSSRQIAFLSGDALVLAELVRRLQGMLGDVVLVNSLEDIGSLPRSSMVAVHYDTRVQAERARLVSDFSAGSNGPTLLLLSEKQAKHDFASLFASHALTNMLVVNGSSINDADLLVTIQKLRTNEIFGMTEKYFSSNVPLHGLQVLTSEDKNGALKAVTDYASSLGIPHRLRMLIRNVTDEYLTNAMYNAPMNPDGIRRYSAYPRTRAVQLESHEGVELQYCCDGYRFGVSVSDTFGSLEPEDVQNHMAKGFRAGEDQVTEGTGGAGLGFYQILDSLSHLVINLERGKRTEMIGLIEVSGGYRSFAKSGKSFNIFVKQATV